MTTSKASKYKPRKTQEMGQRQVVPFRTLFKVSIDHALDKPQGEFVAPIPAPFDAVENILCFGKCFRQAPAILLTRLICLTEPFFKI